MLNKGEQGGEEEDLLNLYLTIFSFLLFVLSIISFSCAQGTVIILVDIISPLSIPFWVWPTLDKGVDHTQPIILLLLLQIYY